MFCIFRRSEIISLSFAFYFGGKYFPISSIISKSSIRQIMQAKQVFFKKKKNIRHKNVKH